MPRPRPDEKAVFLNIPFDPNYERLFVALIVALVAIGRKPRCVLELPEHGQGRLRRIIRHMEACKVSVHDLSRVGHPARFNMPFELGLAYIVKWYNRQSHPYIFILLERVQHRLGRTLSDIAGHSPYIHEARPIGIITAVLDALSTGRKPPSAATIYWIWRKMMRVARTLKEEHGSNTVFTRTIFKRLVAAAGLLAVEHGLIRRRR